MPKQMRFLACSLAIVVLVGGRVGSPRIAASQTAAPALADLRGVDELKGLFNQDTGKVRLVLLLSPT